MFKGPAKWPGPFYAGTVPVFCTICKKRPDFLQFLS